MIDKIKLYIILLFILYIYIIISIYLYFNNRKYKKENFIDILDFISVINKNNIEENNNNSQYIDVGNIENIENIGNIKKEDEKIIIKKNIKKIKKYIYISNINNNNNLIKYKFYNKNNKIYLNVFINSYNKIIIKNDLNNIIGKDINKIHNKITINLNIYKNNIIFEYYNKFNSVKIYLENDDKIFYINKKDKSYEIYLYMLNIGNVIYENNIYKVEVIEDYKIYLNIFGLGIILLLHY